MSRQRIVENISLTPGSYFRKKEDLNESIISVKEAQGDKQYKALAVYTFPISRPNQRNLNNRIYTDTLWENQIRNKRGEGCFGLMDHPENEGSVKDTWCVWRNLRFSADKKLILCDAYLFGNWGRQVLEALEAGGRVGLSSSGWGDFLEDNTTLNPETYELERPADFVLNPSYEVFGVQDDLIESMKNEQISSNLTAINESETLEVSPKENIEENNKMVENKKASPSLEERNFSFNMRSMFKEACKIEDIQERIKENKTLIGYLEGHEDLIKAEIEAKIASDEQAIVEGYKKSFELENKNKELEEQIVNLTKTVEESTSLKETIESLNKQVETLKEQVKENESLKEEFENACTLLDSMKEYTTKQEELVRLAKAEKNSMVSAKEYKETLAFSEELEEENKKLKREALSLKRKLSSLLEASKKKEDDDEDDEDEDDDEDEVNEPETKSSDDDEKDDDEKEEKKESRYSIYKGLNPDVVDYYEDLEYRNPKVVKIKEEILSKHTVLEAQKTYLKLKALVEEKDTKLYRLGEKTYVEKTTKNPIREGWL